MRPTHPPPTSAVVPSRAPLTGPKIARRVLRAASKGTLVSDLLPVVPHHSDRLASMLWSAVAGRFLL